MQAVAIAASEVIEGDIDEVARAITPGVDRADRGSFADSIARQHPITDWHFARRSAVPAFASVTGHGGASAVQSVGSVAQNVDALLDRLSVYVDYLPKQLGWQAEWLLAQAVTREAADGVMAGVMALNRIAAMADSTPTLIVDQLSLTTETVRSELAVGLADIDRQRIATLAALRDERIALMEALGQERITVLSALDGQRVAMLRDLEAVSRSAMNQGIMDSRDLIDHFFWRTSQFALAFLVLTALAILLFRRWVMARPNER